MNEYVEFKYNIKLGMFMVGLFLSIPVWLPFWTLGYYSNKWVATPNKKGNV